MPVVLSAPFLSAKTALAACEMTQAGHPQILDFCNGGGGQKDTNANSQAATIERGGDRKRQGTNIKHHRSAVLYVENHPKN